MGSNVGPFKTFLETVMSQTAKIQTRQSVRSGGLNSAESQLPCHARHRSHRCPPWLGFHGFTAMRSAVWLLHEQHLGPGAPPGAREQASAIVHACPPTKPASCICIIAFCMTFSLREPLPLTLLVTGEGHRPFLAPWTTMGRALRPRPDCISNW